MFEKAKKHPNWEHKCAKPFTLEEADTRCIMEQTVGEFRWAKTVEQLVQENQKLRHDLAKLRQELWETTEELAAAKMAHTIADAVDEKLTKEIERKVEDYQCGQG